MNQEKMPREQEMKFSTYRLLKEVRSTIDQYHMLERGDGVVVAVSGGPDSVSLLHILLSLKEEMGLRLFVAHLDHMFRGKESEEDALFVKEMAGKRGLESIIEAFDVPAYAKSHGLSKQEAARKARYLFLLRAANEFQTQKIALAHTADDQVETILMGLIRGTGRKGLCGISPHERLFSPFAVRRVRLLRPLLFCWKEQLLHYLKDQGIPFRVDPSNQMPLYLRNRIRLDLIPYLERHYNPKVKERLFSTGLLLSLEEEYLNNEVKKISRSLILKEEEGLLSFKRPPYRRLHQALRLRLLRFFIEKIKGDMRDLSYRLLIRADSLLMEGQGQKRMALPQGLSLFTEGERVTISSREPEMPMYLLPGSQEIPVPGESYIPELGLKVTTRLISCHEGEAMELLKASGPKKQFFDRARITPPLFLRLFQPGDRFQPLGMEGRKKLQDFFTDLKIPPSLRRRVPLLLCQEGIIWVMGIRIGQPFRLTPETREALEVAYEEQEGAINAGGSQQRPDRQKS